MGGFWLWSELRADMASSRFGQTLDESSSIDAACERFRASWMAGGSPEIADELYLSVNTVKTHMRHLYDKLGAHRRHQAVEQARALGLLAPSPRRS